MKKKLKIAQFGLGPIGVECVKLAAAKNWAQIVGAVDIDAAKIGQDLGQLTSSKRLRGLRVVDIVDALDQRPDLIFHTAVSRFEQAYPQLEALAERGINVVSSCEELVFPDLRSPQLAKRLDQLCRKTAARIVGTGVNPGFVMDLLPLCLCTALKDVRAIHIQRVVNASTRREPLQRKIGSGLPPEEFSRRLKAGKAGHAGLGESLALIAHCLGWKTSQVVETGEPIIAKNNIRTSYFVVKKGQTCGLHQHATAKVGGQIRLSLDLKMFLGANDPHDAIQIEGDPPLNMIIKGGVAGDQATVAVLVNTAPRLMRAEPGLKLVTDLAVS